MKFWTGRQRSRLSRRRIHQVGLSCNPLPPSGYGGIETVVTSISRGLIKMGVDVICYAPSPCGIDGVRHVATLSEAAQGPKEGVYVANTPEHLDAVALGIKRNWHSGDVIHLHHWEQFSALEKRLECWRPFRKPDFIETAHWTHVGMESHIAYPSEALKRAIGHEGEVIQHGIDTDLFQPCQHSNVDEGQYLFYAGRITPDKGVHIGVAAAKKLGIPFRIAGPLQDADYAEAVLKDAEYLGELDGPAIARQYGGALALVYMTQYTEPFGLSVVEAMACGTPVITTGRGGTGETVIEGKTGFFCETEEDVVLAIGRLQSLSREECAERGQQFSIEAMTSGYLKYYSKACA